MPRRLVLPGLRFRAQPLPCELPPTSTPPQPGSSPVRAGDELDLELELGPPRAWDELVGPGTRTDPSPRVPALVEQAFDDGVIVVRIGTTVAQLEIVGEVPESVAGLNVSVPISDLKFFPTGA